MEWDPKQLAYIDDAGNPVSPAQMREWINSYIENERAEVDDETQQLRDGKITVAAFIAFMSEKIQTIHGAAALIAYGGQDQMTARDWARLQPVIDRELEYLNGFEQDLEKSYQAAQLLASNIALDVARDPNVPPGLDSVIEEKVFAALLGNSSADVESAVQAAIVDSLADSIGREPAEEAAKSSSGLIATARNVGDALVWGGVAARAGQYMRDAYGTYENSVRANIQDAASEQGAVILEMRSLNSKVPCADCPGYADRWEPEGTLPDIGDDCECGSNCLCEFSYDLVSSRSAEFSVAAVN